MIKVKDGYGKLINTSYLGSSNRVLLSNGGDKTFGNTNGDISINNGTVNDNLNADLLDGLHASAFKIAWITCAGKSHIGWVSIIKWNVTTPGHFSPDAFLLNIYRVYNSPQPEQYTLQITFGWGTANIIQLNGCKGNRQIIENFRIVCNNEKTEYRLEYYVNREYTTYLNNCYCSLFAYNSFTGTTINEISNSNMAIELCNISTKPGYIVGKFSGEIDKVANYYISRPNSLDPGITGDGSMFQFKSTGAAVSSTTYPGDGHILHFNWDNVNGYDAQLFLDIDQDKLKTRRMTGKTWNPWKTVAYTDSDITGNAATATTASYLTNFSAGNSTSWGQLISTNGYNQVLNWRTSNNGGIVFATNGDKLNMQIDGYFYQSEGKNRITDVTETVTDIGVTSEYLYKTKNGITDYYTIPYASSANNATILNSVRYDSDDPGPNKTVGLTFQFSNLSGISWQNVLTMNSYGDSNYLSAQIATPAGNPGSDINSGVRRWRQGRNSTWLDWRVILDSSNFSNYALPLTGGDITGDVSFVMGDTDKFINWVYSTSNRIGAGWRAGVLGSGSGDTNYYTIQSGTSGNSEKTWNTALRIGQNTYDAGFGGNVYPLVTNTKTLGTSSLKWANVYATTFTGDLIGNASTATSLTTNAGSSNQPVYFSGGVPVAAKSLEANIKSYLINTASDNDWDNVGGNYYGALIGIIRTNSTDKSWMSSRYSPTLIFGNEDVKSTISIHYSIPLITFAGGKGTSNSPKTNPNWYFKLSGTTDCTYTLPTTSSTLVNTTYVDNILIDYVKKDGTSENSNNLTRSASYISIPAEGWYKLAYIKSTDARGSVRLGLFTTGGNYAPMWAELKVSNGWSVVVINQTGRFAWISGYRYTTDSEYSYIEAYFISACQIYLYKFNGVAYVDDFTYNWSLYNTPVIGSGSAVFGNTQYNKTTHSSLYTSGDIEGAGFVKTGSSDDYLLLGGGGHISSTGFLRYYNSNTVITNTNIVNTPSYVATVSTSGGTITNSNKPSGMDNAWGVIHLHTHVGNYATQLGFGGTTGRMYMRNAYSSETFGSWQTLAFLSDIPDSLPANGGNADTVDGKHASDFLPITGGTLTGWLKFDNEQGILQINGRYKENGGGWTANTIYSKGPNNELIYNLGCFGYNSSIHYVYLGCNTYTGVNFRIYPDRVAYGTNTILHEGNYTDYINTTNFPGLNATGTITSVKIGNSSYSPSSGVVTLPEYPTIPSVGNGTITINQNGMSIGTFTMNQSNNSTINLSDTKYNFEGTSFISTDSTIPQDCDKVVVNGHYYYNYNGPSTSLGATTTDGALYTQAYSTNWVGQIAQDYRTGDLFTRGKKDGSWQPWKKVLYSGDLYWANVAVSTTSNSETKPTFSNTITGSLTVKPNLTTRREGIRIGATSTKWSLLMLLGPDVEANGTGTSNKSWGFFNNDGTLYINLGAEAGNNSSAPGAKVTATKDGWTYAGPVTSAKGFYDTSDARLKDFLTDIQIDFEKLSQLPKMYFTWVSDRNKEMPELQIGTSAQALQKLYPELVKDDGDILHVAYDKLSIIALKAVDDLYTMVKELKAVNAKLKSKVDKLERRVYYGKKY